MTLNIMTIVIKIINNKIAAAKIVPKSFDEIFDLNFFFAKNIGLVFEEDFNGTWRRKVCHSWLAKNNWTGKKYFRVVLRRGRVGAVAGAGLVGGAAGSVVAMTAYVEL